MARYSVAIGAYWLKTTSVTSTSRSETSPTEQSQSLPTYASLKQLIASKGLLLRTPRYYVRSGLSLAIFSTTIFLGLYLLRSTWWVLFLTPAAALLFGQLGFMAHDATHNQISNSSRGNYLISVLLFNLTLGGSRGWWAEKHNAHHASPNRFGVDPDIEGGVIALSRSEYENASGLIKGVMRLQTKIIAPLLTLSVLQIAVYSFANLFKPALRRAGVEATLFLTHWIVYLGSLVVMLGILRGLLFALIHQMLLGFYLGGAFLPNHVGMPVSQEGDIAEDFMHRQISASRNLKTNFLVDFLFGGLNLQIEHHLFPAMPRYRLREANALVRQFCVEHKIAYKETGVFEAYKEVYAYLALMVVPLQSKAAA